MNKKIVRLTESDLHNIIMESVNRIIKESPYSNFENDYEDRNDALDYADAESDMMMDKYYESMGIKEELPDWYDRM